MARVAPQQHRAHPASEDHVASEDGRGIGRTCWAAQCLEGLALAQLLGKGLSCSSGARCCSGPESRELPGRRGEQGAEGSGMPARLETHTVKQAWCGTSELTTLPAWKLLDALGTSTTPHFSGLQRQVFPCGRGGCGPAPSHAPLQRAGNAQRRNELDLSDLLLGSPSVSGLPDKAEGQHLSPLSQELEAGGSCLLCRAHSTSGRSQEWARLGPLQGVLLAFAQKQD